MRWFSTPVVQITRIIPFLHSYVSDWYPGVWWAFVVEIIVITSLFLSLQSIGETIMIDILFFYCPNGILLQARSQRGVSQIYLKFIYSGKVVIHVTIEICSTSSFRISPTWIYSWFFFWECNNSGQLMGTEEEAMPQSDKAVLKKPWFGKKRLSSTLICEVMLSDDSVAIRL